MGRCVDVIHSLALFAHKLRIAFRSLRFIKMHEACVGLDEAAIKNPARQSLVVIGLNRFEIAH